MSSSGRRRVVITGMGALTPLGNNVNDFWEGVKQCRNGIEQIQKYVDCKITTNIGGEIKDFDAAEWIGDKKYVRQTDPFVHFAVVTADEAIQDSGLDLGKIDLTRVGCIIGSGIGGLNEIEEGNRILFERGPSRFSPFFIPKLMLNAAAGHVAIRLGLQGPNFATASACAAANHAIGCAFRTIQYGDADVMVTGGTEAAVTILGMGGFCAARALSRRNDDPSHASRPFDKERDGFVMGEGAGSIVLEELEYARARDARIYAEVVGYGATDDAFHMTAPAQDGAGAVRSMEAALKDAGAALEDVTYVNAHGTSTPYNDKTETLAMKKVFGDWAGKLQISSTKSMIGHLLGASGAVELIVTAKAIEQGVIPPTRNLTVPDPECDLDYVPGESREGEINIAISNSFGFGGHNATIALAKFRG